MTRRILLVVLALLGLAWQAGAEGPSADVFAGHWRQVATNAGQCATCRLTVSRNDTTYSVAASNGWNVEVKQLKGLGDAVYVGGGRWDRSPPRMHPERRLATHFVLRDKRLHMRMLLSRPDGSRWQIDATFERENLMM